MKGFMRNDIPAHTEDPVTDEVISKYGVRVHTRTTVPHSAFYPGRRHTRRAGRSQAAELG